MQSTEILRAMERDAEKGVNILRNEDFFKVFLAVGGNLAAALDAWYTLKFEADRNDELFAKKKRRTE